MLRGMGEGEAGVVRMRWTSDDNVECRVSECTIYILVDL